MSLDPQVLIAQLRSRAPSLLRWGGGLARVLRRHNIALEGKSSGSANTDALTLADLSVQQLLVDGLRDACPLARGCRMEAEEETGDLAAFTTDAPLTVALDPIDGTRQFRDRTGDGYAVMLHVRSADEMLYSLVYLPEMSEGGTWVEANGATVRCGPDDPGRPAEAVLDALTPISPQSRGDSSNIYLIGFQERDAECAAAVTAAGLVGFAPDAMPGSIYPLLATGEFGGSLIHSPNVYDFPVSAQIARAFGGEAAWVDGKGPVHFRETWLDDRADMLRLPGIVACAVNRDKLVTLIELARDWNPNRYTD